MLYLNHADILDLGVDWDANIDVIERAVRCIANEEYSQPIKPYLRFQNQANRIIAMPAYAGGAFQIAGIKWIASFPDNIQKGLPRANSVTILNDAETGVPIATINTSLISVIRTSAVSGLIVKYYENTKRLENIQAGIVGFGPIGKFHLKMLCSLLGERLSKIYIYDVAGVQPEEISHLEGKVEICKSWEDAYVNSDIFITCTVSKSGYIDRKPKDNALILNVSLRDFRPEILKHTKSIIVDNWEEVCRENTDILHMNEQMGLQKEHTKSIVDIVLENELKQRRPNDAIMFNPMGMAIFDIAMAHHYYKLAMNRGIGTLLSS
ncbi:2,3-diaminopropionate biosynthesis protein SbnB [Paenibacillus sp. chi10]|uniref:2,3-diaminopropionate biosynthesis protein SbnB n=1 Tax=Paenibacillus suaedae TaxID=3077233 RepID=A0AAJ2JXW6_9BACL|nr:2,3-diaminopropionate biosynthesis protein SbnB [Paenibacillus sp. chi10]MDT8977779.1 2,3-diaminopropionate biosynthesis protein SbnB [Paenibacillus sp. chi10]